MHSVIVPPLVLITVVIVTDLYTLLVWFLEEAPADMDVGYSQWFVGILTS